MLLKKSSTSKYLDMFCPIKPKPTKCWYTSNHLFLFCQLKVDVSSDNRINLHVFWWDGTSSRSSVSRKTKIFTSHSRRWIKPILINQCIICVDMLVFQNQLKTKYFLDWNTKFYKRHTHLGQEMWSTSWQQKKYVFSILIMEMSSSESGLSAIGIQ